MKKLLITLTLVFSFSSSVFAGSSLKECLSSIHKGTYDEEKCFFIIDSYKKKFSKNFNLRKLEEYLNYFRKLNETKQAFMGIVGSSEFERTRMKCLSSMKFGQCNQSICEEYRDLALKAEEEKCRFHDLYKKFEEKYF